MGERKSIGKGSLTQDTDQHLGHNILGRQIYRVRVYNIFLARKKKGQHKRAAKKLWLNELIRMIPAHMKHVYGKSTPGA